MELPPQKLNPSNVFHATFQNTFFFYFPRSLLLTPEDVDHTKFVEGAILNPKKVRTHTLATRPNSQGQLSTIALLHQQNFS